jgi:sugar lactone lactonase YvrE
MKRHYISLLLVVVLGIVTVQSAHLASLDLPANQPAYLVDFDLPTGYLAEKIFAPPLQSPEHVAISPTGAIVVTGGDADRVIQVHEDGTLTTYADPSSNPYSGVAFDAAGNLYVVDWAGVLWKVTPSGSATQLAGEMYYNSGLDVAPSGDVFAVNSSTAVLRITPTGQVSVYASGLTNAKDVAVSPITGQVYVMDWDAGAIYRANPNGTVTLLTSGLSNDATHIAFAPDGTLYHMGIIPGFSRISTANGKRTEITWVQEYIPGDFAFDSQGRVVTANATTNYVVRYHLDTETVDILVEGLGNTTALAVAPGGGGIYFGVNGLTWREQGKVLRIEADGSVTPFITGLPDRVRSMTFDAQGTGYIAAGDDVYTTTLTGITGTLITLDDAALSLAVEPTTNRLWGIGNEELWYLDELDVRHAVPFTLSTNQWVHSIAFTPDGTLYLYTITGDPNITPVVHGVYRVNPAGPTYTLIADLTTIHVCCLGPSQIGAGHDGNIYWVGFGDRYTVGNEADMHMVRVTPAGQVTLFARNLPIDPLAVTGSLDSTDLYFTSSEGVYRVFEVKQIFLPVILKGSR